MTLRAFEAWRERYGLLEDASISEYRCLVHQLAYQVCDHDYCSVARHRCRVPESEPEKDFHDSGLLFDHARRLSRDPHKSFGARTGYSVLISAPYTNDESDVTEIRNALRILLKGSGLSVRVNDKEDDWYGDAGFTSPIVIWNKDVIDMGYADETYQF